MNIITESIYEGFSPLPKKIEGWNGESSIFDELISKVRPRHIIEVGTWLGQSALTMAKSVKRHGLQTRITCIDTWLGALEFWGDMKHTSDRDLRLLYGYPQVYYQFLSNVVHEGMQDTILPFPCTSSIAARHLKKQGVQAELIYIDGSHDYDDVMSDLASYFPLVAPGGIMFGDDFGWPGVARAVVAFFQSIHRTVRIVDNNFWVIDPE